MDNYVVIPVEKNFYHKGYTGIIKIAFNSVEQCMKYFDDLHKKKESSHCGTPLCDYCKAEWELKDGIMTKCVDNDGAYVEYMCIKCFMREQN